MTFWVWSTLILLVIVLAQNGRRIVGGAIDVVAWAKGLGK